MQHTATYANEKKGTAYTRVADYMTAVKIGTE